MDVAKALDEQINEYLVLLNDKQKEAVLTVVKTFAEDQEVYEYDEAFQQELDTRFSSYATGENVLTEKEVMQSLQKLIGDNGRH